MLPEELLYEGDQSLGEIGAGVLVCIGGQLVEGRADGVDEWVVHQVGPGGHALGAEHPAHHGDDRAVRLGHRSVGPGGGELRRQVGRRRLTQYEAESHPGPLQPLDGGRQFGVERTQCFLRMVVGLAHIGDLGQREPPGRPGA
ncbi:hypothetical protein [Streptomyces sp. NPDC087300]|uniref:hypothetical protein n=1 Tax=Streptomyces sp. NPDC087300 TaxID=3365780 RepID=UPI00381E23B5